MQTRDWALIIFTILTQMSVGSFVVLGVVHFFAMRKAGAQEADRMSDRALLAIGPLLVIATLASLLHLGHPVNAYRAINNLGSSWLSREILFTLLFLVTGGVFAVMQWRKIASFAVRNVVAWVAAIIGLVLIYSMSHIYMVKTIPVWDTLATPFMFYTTAFLLGSLAMGAAFVANYSYMQRRQEAGCTDNGIQCDLLRSVLRGLSLVAIVLVGVEFVVTPLYLADLSSGTAAAQQSAHKIINDYGVLLGVRLALVFLGAAILGAFLYRNASSPGRTQLMGNLTYAAFALVLGAEVMGRVIFYASQIGIGIFKL